MFEQKRRTAIFLFALQLLTLSGEVSAAQAPCFYATLKAELDTDACLTQIKRQAADSRRFWFGRRSWLSELCSDGSENMQCLHSVGSRLLRVRTFDSAYLKNVLLFPRAKFRSEPGTQRYCDHTFVWSSSKVVMPHPNMVPSDTWHLRNEPLIWWEENALNKTFYTVAIVDVGFGSLHYLIHNFPAEHTVDRSYSPPVGRSRYTNPIVIVVLEQDSWIRSVRWSQFVDERTNRFNFRDFVLNNPFPKGIVGLNWINIKTGGIGSGESAEHCTNLLRKKIYPLPPFDFLTPEQLDSAPLRWMSAGFETNTDDFPCCKARRRGQVVAVLDPLGDKSLPLSIASSGRLFIRTSISQAADKNDFYSYNRDDQRRHISLLGVEDERYALLLVSASPDSDNPYFVSCRFMTTNIDLRRLNGEFRAENASEKDTVVPYTNPKQLSPDQRFVLLLFRQRGGRNEGILAKNLCTGIRRSPLTEPCQFDLRFLMGRYSLELTALSWLRLTTDEQSERNFCRTLPSPQQVCISSKFPSTSTTTNINSPSATFLLLLLLNVAVGAAGHIALLPMG